MNIKQNITHSSKKLISTSTSPMLDAEVLLTFIMNIPREHILTHPEQELNKAEQEQYSALIKEREKEIPIAYLVGKKAFFGEEFIVTPSVLIPRPETETIIEFALQKIYEHHLAKENISLADIGTGSGAIALSIAKILQKASVTASDISAEALEVVQKNLTEHTEVQNVELIQSNLLESYPEKKYDVMIANLPYLSKEAYTATSNEVQFEPEKALVAKDNGMFFYKELFKQLAPFISEKLLLFIEIDPHQYDELSGNILSLFPKSKTEPIWSENKECKLGLFSEIYT